MNPAVGCYYFPPGLRLPSQPENITAFRLEPQAVAVRPYGWLMTHYGWLAGLSRSFYGGGVSYGGLRRLTADWRVIYSVSQKIPPDLFLTFFPNG